MTGFQSISVATNGQREWLLEAYDGPNYDGKLYNESDFTVKMSDYKEICLQSSTLLRSLKFKKKSDP